MAISGHWLGVSPSDRAICLANWPIVEFASTFITAPSGELRCCWARTVPLPPLEATSLSFIIGHIRIIICLMTCIAAALRVPIETNLQRHCHSQYHFNSSSLFVYNRASHYRHNRQCNTVVAHLLPRRSTACLITYEQHFYSHLVAIDATDPSATPPIWQCTIGDR